MNRTTAIRLVEQLLNSNDDDELRLEVEEKDAIRQLLTAYKALGMPQPADTTIHVQRAASPTRRYTLVAKDRRTGKLLRNSFTSAVARDAWVAGTLIWAEVISIYEEDQEPCPPTK